MKDDELYDDLEGWERDYELIEKEDQPLTVSMDPTECSCGEIRVFGDVLEVMKCSNEIVLVCDGNFNYPESVVIASLNKKAE